MKDKQTHDVHKKYMQIRFNTHIKKVRMWNELHKVMMAKCNSKCYLIGFKVPIGSYITFICTCLRS